MRSAGLLLPLLVLGAVLLGLRFEAEHPKLSPIDELQHIDYAAKASHGQIVRRGEYVGDAAMRADACRGVAVDFLHPPPCDSATFDPGYFQEGGQSTAYQDPPLYYGLTGGLARLLAAIAPGDFVTWCRRIGAGWLALALVTTWAAFGELGVTRVRRAVALLPLVSTPVVLFTESTVTPDAVLPVVGGASLWAVLRWERGGGARWPVVAVVILGMLAKLNAVVATAVCAGYLLARAATGAPQRTRSEYVRLAAVVLTSAAVVAVAWILVMEWRALAPSDAIGMHRRSQVDSIGAPAVFSAVPTMLSPVLNPPLAEALEPTTTLTFVALYHVLLVGGALGLAFRRGTAGTVQAMSNVVVALAILLGPLLVLWNFLTQGVYYPPPSRYALALLPALSLLLGSAIENRVGVLLVSALGISSYLFVTSRVV